jgi:hypothetical protein
MRMLKVISILALLAISIPVALFAGFGFQNGLDVDHGLKTAVLELAGLNITRSDNKPVPHDQVPTQKKVVRWLGDVEDEAISEASGIAVSHHNSDVLFSINDSGNEPRLFAFGVDGTTIGSWPLNYSGIHDFEDVSIFKRAGKSYLLLADTGDNLLWRPHTTILVVEEPSIETISSGIAIDPAWKFDVIYPDGYRDIEAVAVDEDSETIFLLSKRHIPAEVLTVPLKPEMDSVQATFVTRLRGIPEPTERDKREDSRYGAFRSMPTALDIRGRTAIVLTYKHAYLFKRGRGQSWAEAFYEIPIRIPLPVVSGLESLTFSRAGNSFYVTGERENGVDRMGLFQIDL